MTWSCISFAYLEWRAELAQDPGGGCAGLAEGTSCAVSNEAVLGVLFSPGSHKTRYMMFLLSPLGSLNYSSLPMPSDFAVVAMENVEVLAVKGPEASAALNNWAARGCTVLHPSAHSHLPLAQLSAGGILHFHHKCKAGHLNKNLHAIWNWHYIQTKEECANAHPTSLS